MLFATTRRGNSIGHHGQLIFLDMIIFPPLVIMASTRDRRYHYWNWLRAPPQASIAAPHSLGRPSRRRSKQQRLRFSEAAAERFEDLFFLDAELSISLMVFNALIEPATCQPGRFLRIYYEVNMAQHMGMPMSAPNFTSFQARQVSEATIEAQSPFRNMLPGAII